MKNYLLCIAIFLSSVFISFSDVPSDNERQAILGAIENVSSSIRTAPFGKKTVAILPLIYTEDWNDSNYGDTLIGPLKNVLTKAGFICIDGKEDPMWTEIMHEIAWEERKNDILDQKTLTAFGKMKSAQILLYGKLVNLSENPERVYTEIELHATEIATAQHIWGGTFANRFYISKDVEGIICLDSSLRQLLKKNFEQVYNSLTDAAFSSKLKKLQSISVIPLAGDIDEYITGLTLETMTHAGLTPKNPQIPSLSLTRAFIRDNQLNADGILYGAVRDLKKSRYKSADTSTKDAYEISADIQLNIEDAIGNVLWSKTVTIVEEEMFSKPMGDIERIAKENLGLIGWSILGIIGLLFLLFAMKMILSFFYVR